MNGTVMNHISLIRQLLRFRAAGEEQLLLDALAGIAEMRRSLVQQLPAKALHHGIRATTRLRQTPSRLILKSRRLDKRGGGSCSGSNSLIPRIGEALQSTARVSASLTSSRVRLLLQWLPTPELVSRQPVIQREPHRQILPKQMQKIPMQCLSNCVSGEVGSRDSCSTSSGKQQGVTVTAPFAVADAVSSSPVNVCSRQRQARIVSAGPARPAVAVAESFIRPTSAASGRESSATAELLTAEAATAGAVAAVQCVERRVRNGESPILAEPKPSARRSSSNSRGNPQESTMVFTTFHHNTQRKTTCIRCSPCRVQKQHFFMLQRRPLSACERYFMKTHCSKPRRYPSAQIVYCSCNSNEPRYQRTPANVVLRIHNAEWSISDTPTVTGSATAQMALRWEQQQHPLTTQKRLAAEMCAKYLKRELQIKKHLDRYSKKLSSLREKLKQQQQQVQQQQLQQPPQRPPWDNAITSAPSEAAKPALVSPRVRPATKLPAAAVEAIGARLYGRAKQMAEMRALRQQLKQQHSQPQTSIKLSSTTRSSKNYRQSTATGTQQRKPVQHLREGQVLQQLQTNSLHQQHQQKLKRQFLSLCCTGPPVSLASCEPPGAPARGRQEISSSSSCTTRAEAHQQRQSQVQHKAEESLQQKQVLLPTYANLQQQQHHGGARRNVVMDLHHSETEVGAAVSPRRHQGCAACAVLLEQQLQLQHQLTLLQGLPKKQQKPPSLQVASTCSGSAANPDTSDPAGALGKQNSLLLQTQQGQEEQCEESQKKQQPLQQQDQQQHEQLQQHPTHANLQQQQHHGGARRNVVMDLHHSETEVGAAVSPRRHQGCAACAVLLEQQLQLQHQLTLLQGLPKKQQKPPSLQVASTCSGSAANPDISDPAGALGKQNSLLLQTQQGQEEQCEESQKEQQPLQQQDQQQHEQLQQHPKRQPMQHEQHKQMRTGATAIPEGRELEVVSRSSTKWIEGSTRQVDMYEQQQQQQEATLLGLQQAGQHTKTSTTLPPAATRVSDFAAPPPPGDNGAARRSFRLLTGCSSSLFSEGEWPGALVFDTFDRTASFKKQISLDQRSAETPEELSVAGPVAATRIKDAERSTLTATPKQPEQVACNTCLALCRGGSSLLSEGEWEDRKTLGNPMGHCFPFYMHRQQQLLQQVEHQTEVYPYYNNGDIPAGGAASSAAAAVHRSCEDASDGHFFQTAMQHNTVYKTISQQEQEELAVHSACAGIGGPTPLLLQLRKLHGSCTMQQQAQQQQGLSLAQLRDMQEQRVAAVLQQQQREHLEQRQQQQRKYHQKRGVGEAPHKKSTECWKYGETETLLQHHQWSSSLQQCCKVRERQRPGKNLKSFARSCSNTTLELQLQKHQQSLRLYAGSSSNCKYISAVGMNHHQTKTTPEAGCKSTSIALSVTPFSADGSAFLSKAATADRGSVGTTRFPFGSQEHQQQTPQQQHLLQTQQPHHQKQSQASSKMHCKLNMAEIPQECPRARGSEGDPLANQHVLNCFNRTKTIGLKQPLQSNTETTAERSALLVLQHTPTEPHLAQQPQQDDQQERRSETQSRTQKLLPALHHKQHQQEKQQKPVRASTIVAAHRQALLLHDVSPPQKAPTAVLLPHRKPNNLRQQQQYVQTNSGDDNLLSPGFLAKNEQYLIEFQRPVQVVALHEGGAGMQQQQGYSHMHIIRPARANGSLQKKCQQPQQQQGQQTPQHPQQRNVRAAEPTLILPSRQQLLQQQRQQRQHQCHEQHQNLQCFGGR